MPRITTERGNGKKENGSSKKGPAAKRGGIPDFNAVFAGRNTESEGPDIECRSARPSEIRQLLREHWGVVDPEEADRIVEVLDDFMAESRGSDSITSNFKSLGMSVGYHGVASHLDRVLTEELGEDWEKPLNEPPLK